MPQPSKKYVPSRIVRALVTVCLCAPLCACITSGTPPIKVTQASIPKSLVAPTPAPLGANPDTVTDIQYGELVQNLDNALAACNADKADIAKLVQVK